MESPQYQARVRIDLNDTEPLRRIWRYVGYDEPNYTYTPRGEELLAKLERLPDAPYFIRCHFLLCSGDGTGSPKWGSTNVYTEDADGSPVYSWDIVDRILDAILRQGCMPFVELGFTPEALSTAPADVPYDQPQHGGWRFPPRDYGRWGELMRELGAHCLERYGLRSVSQWYWELWNEPDIHYWAGTDDDYNRLYDYTVSGLTAAIPLARVGGPGVANPARPAGAGLLRSFLQHCTRGPNALSGQPDTRLDFLSFHTKGGRAPRDPNAPKETPTIHALVNRVEAGLAIISEFPQVSGLELILTEADPDGWAAGGKHDNPNLAYRNSEYYASFLASAACKLMEATAKVDVRVDGMLTWAFQFEEREFFEGLRVLSTNGIDKPVLNALRLLAELGPVRCGLQSDASRDPMAAEGDRPSDPPDVSGLATLDHRGRVKAILVSHHDDWDVGGSTDTLLTVQGLVEGEYSVRCRAVDRSRANSHTAWQAMGEPQDVTDAQRVEMTRASRLATEEMGRVVARDGRAELSLELSAHAVVLVELDPIQ